MRFLLLLLLTTLTFVTGSAQDLTGRWEGTFKFGNMKITFSNVYLTFTSSPDGYYVLSSRRGQYIDDSDTTVSFNVKFQTKGKNRLFLDEDKLISPDTLKIICYTSYRLRIRTAHNQTLLEGRYFQRNCNEASDIFFRKVE